MVYYLVVLGIDRCFNKIRDNVVLYINVGINIFVIFYDLDLILGVVVYYFFVYVISKFFFKLLVIFNGFYVGYDGGVVGIGVWNIVELFLIVD